MCFSLILLITSLSNLEEVLVKRNKNNILKNLHSQIIFLNLLESEQKKESYIQFLISVYNFKKSSFNYLFFVKKEQDFLFKDTMKTYMYSESILIKMVFHS